MTARINHRVRAILLTGRGTILLIKRLRSGRAPYWVLPGGGVEPTDSSFEEALARELDEEIGGSAKILSEVFYTEYPGLDEMDGWTVQHHYYVCLLDGYDLSRRYGPEFSDPSKGEYLLDEVLLEPDALDAITFLSDEIKDFLMTHAEQLRRCWMPAPTFA